VQLFGGLIATVAKRVTPTPAPAPAAKKVGARRVELDTDAQVYFGKKVRELREAKGWSQEDLAKAVSMVQTKLPAIEQGRRDVHLSTVQRFAKALGVTIQDLLPPSA
jgi:ribosome-binding protein aMBF1 (putative translation factor)